MRYSSGPVRDRERISSLDILRGIAVLGILVMNIYAFAMPMAAYSNPLAGGGTGALDMGTWFVTHLLFDQKFMSIFSMMFGAGIVLMSRRADAKEVRFAPIFYRRQFWLMLMGLLHAYFIWLGDILFFYALCGMLVYVLHRRTARTQIIVACILLPIVPLLNFGFGSYTIDLQQRASTYEERAAAGGELTEEEQAAIDEWDEMKAFVQPGPEEYAVDVAAYRGSYSDAMTARVPFVKTFHTLGFFFFGLWRIGAMMLIGMALMQLGMFDASRSMAFYRNAMLAGYGFGLPLVIVSALQMLANAWEPLWMFRVGYNLNYFGSIAMALGHVALVMLIVKSGLLSGLMSRFAAVGRMALSNYLMQSIVMTTIFYGHGLGWYDQVLRLQLMGFVAALFAVQLVLSPWWLSRYRFGPAEWLWRSLTYWERQPFRRTAQVA